MSENIPSGPERAANPAPPTEAISVGSVDTPKPPIGKGTKISLTIAVVLVALIAIFAFMVPKFLPAPQQPAADYVGSWVAGKQSLEILANGEARGSDGCNGQGAKWSYEGEGIAFDGFFGTKMACVDADGKYEQGWLPSSAAAVLDSKGELHFFDRNGDELGSMVQGRPAERPAPGTAPGPLTDVTPSWETEESSAPGIAPGEPNPSAPDFDPEAPVSPEPRPMDLDDLGANQMLIQVTIP